MRAILSVVLSLACVSAHAGEVLPGPYPAEILRVIDGDTVEARVHVWLGLDQTVRVRLRGIDAPELHGPCPGAAIAARDHLAEVLKVAPVTVLDISHDKYGGRVDARLRLADGADVASLMTVAGHAVPATRSRAARCPKEKPP